MLDGGPSINLRNDEGGALLNKTDIWEQTPLIVACMTRKEVIASIILDKGADYNGTRQYRGTPMSEAVRNDDDKIVRLLLEKDAK